MRASVVGAGSFGTAVALLLVRAGERTTLLCRSQEQAAELGERAENERYLPGVPLPKELKVRALGGRPDQFHRADLVFLAVLAQRLADALPQLIDLRELDTGHMGPIEAPHEVTEAIRHLAGTHLGVQAAAA